MNAAASGSSRSPSVRCGVGLKSAEATWPPLRSVAIARSSAPPPPSADPP
ncbi:MAG TPA: hypothetical protein VG370_01275 [Chloroflexota bacterium]|nr:hypothetical protein [Chloroflexota bacterium]